MADMEEEKLFTVLNYISPISLEAGKELFNPTLYAPAAHLLNKYLFCM
jgi:hypothetical protein